MRIGIGLSMLLGSVSGLVLSSSAFAGPYAPQVGEAGSTAISKDDVKFKAWATSVEGLVRGPVDIKTPGGAKATFGTGTSALGPAKGTAFDVVSLGDGGAITLGFTSGIGNGPGADFAVFENGFSEFLELAYVAVSSDGVHFATFPSVSLTQTSVQVDQANADTGIDATDLNDLAGKYVAGFGTPFDLAELVGTANLDVDHIKYVRLTDVVGRITPIGSYTPSLDSLGHIINDPYATPFASGGFDVGGVGVINVAVPEPGVVGLVVPVAALLGLRRRRGAR